MQRHSISYEHLFDSRSERISSSSAYHFNERIIPVSSDIDIHHSPFIPCISEAQLRLRVRRLWLRHIRTGERWSVKVRARKQPTRQDQQSTQRERRGRSSKNSFCWIERGSPTKRYPSVGLVARHIEWMVGSEAVCRGMERMA
jgi:hypothetical protein